MAARVGIELAPLSCRIVQLADRLVLSRVDANTSVTGYMVRGRQDPATIAAFARLRNRQVSVVLWGTTTEYRHLDVDRGSVARMRAAAEAALHAGHPSSRWNTLVDVAPATRAEPNAPRFTLIATAAAAAEVATALRPLRLAGAKIDAVLTPAAALLSLARVHRPAAVMSDAVDAYVVLDQSACCAALICAGRLLAAREFPFGFLDPHREWAPRAAVDIASDLVPALIGFAHSAIGDERLSQVAICGGAPDLRSLCVRLTEQLDTEVEPLDTLFCIDESTLGDGNGDFRNLTAELRLAWAAAADGAPALNLLRARRETSHRRRVAMATIAAGIASGLAVGFRVQPAIGVPQDVVQQALDTREIRLDAAGDLQRRAELTAQTQRPPQTAAAPPAVDIYAVPAHVQVPRVTPSATDTTEHPLDHEPRRGSTEPAPPQPAVFEKPVTASAPAAAPRRERALPMTASVDTILVGVDRALAIVDGHIVAPGDAVRGGQVVEITTSGVLVRDGEGRLRRLLPPASTSR